MKEKNQKKQNQEEEDRGVYMGPCLRGVTLLGED